MVELGSLSLRAIAKIVSRSSLFNHPSLTFEMVNKIKNTYFSYLYIFVQLRWILGSILHTRLIQIHMFRGWKRNRSLLDNYLQKFGSPKHPLKTPKKSFLCWKSQPYLPSTIQNPMDRIQCRRNKKKDEFIAVCSSPPSSQSKFVRTFAG